MRGSEVSAVQQTARGPFAFRGRWLVIYKIKSIRDLSRGVINGIRCLRREHKRSLTRMGNGVLSKHYASKGDCVVLLFVSFFFFKPRVD